MWTTWPSVLSPGDGQQVRSQAKDLAECPRSGHSASSWYLHTRFMFTVTEEVVCLFHLTTLPLRHTTVLFIDYMPVRAGCWAGRRRLSATPTDVTRRQWRHVTAAEARRWRRRAAAPPQSSSPWRRSSWRRRRGGMVYAPGAGSARPRRQARPAATASFCDVVVSRWLHGDVTSSRGDRLQRQRRRGGSWRLQAAAAGDGVCRSDVIVRWSHRQVRVEVIYVMLVQHIR